MNKKGFISVTVIYSFFLVFLTLMMLIIVNMTSNRNLLNGMKKTIKNDISSSENKRLSDYIKSKYTGVQGSNGIYYHDLALSNGSGDYSYRYAGANPSNYVCFGSTEATCPDNNKYRIIGVFDNRVKLIKATSLGNMQWNSAGQNTWANASINTYLNKTFLSSFANEWSSKIVYATWQIGGNIWSNIGLADANNAYQNEIINSSGANSTDGSTEYSAKIGLMYVSDYGFAASSNAWSAYLNSYSSYSSSNWLYLGSIEWLITRQADDAYTNRAFLINSGSLSGYTVTSSYAIRPVFYLNSSVTYSSGTGASNEPIRIN